MPDLNGWPLLCLIVMAVVIAGNHISERKGR